MTDVFPLSLLFCFLLWFVNKNFKNQFVTNLRASPQTFHKKSTSRLGGIAIYFPLLITAYFIDETGNYDFLRLALLCCIPVFLIGLMDDINFNVKPIYRLLLLLPTPILFFFLLDIRIESVGINFFDAVLKIEILGLLFLSFSLVGIINAFNIIDGFNGLLLTYCLSILLTLILAYESNSGIDWLTFMVALFLATFALFLFNFPFGKLFLGDAGAYLLGAICCDKNIGMSIDCIKKGIKVSFF